MSARATQLDFRDLLALSKQNVEIELKAMLLAREHQWRSLGPEVRAVVHAASDMTLRGGKRFRAALFAAVHCGLVGKWTPATSKGGAALELLQSYLLIQDDWMDGDVERRGGPSAHVLLSAKLGGAEPGAIAAMLASDLLAGMAFETLAIVNAPTARRIAALKTFARVHEDVVMGQVLDTVAKKAKLEDVHQLKTGSYTIRGPLLLGSALGGGGARLTAQLEAFAAPLGMGFQLRDDLLGVFGDEKNSGRPRGSDLRSGKNSAVLREAKPRLRAAERAAVKRVFGKSSPNDSELDAAIGALRDCGAYAAVETQFYQLCDSARQLAAKIGKRSIANHLGQAVDLLRDLPIHSDANGAAPSITLRPQLKPRAKGHGSAGQQAPI